MTRIKLSPGDYVLTEGLDEGTYHKIAKEFERQGCPAWPYKMNAGAKIAGWSYRFGTYGWTNLEEYRDSFKRKLTIAQVLGENDYEIKVGDRVKIVAGCEWDLNTRTNPKCPGCIVGNGNLEGWLRVKWDNGELNAYPKDCLRRDEPDMPEVGSRWLDEDGQLCEVMYAYEQWLTCRHVELALSKPFVARAGQLKPIKSQRDKAVDTMLASMEHAVENHTGTPCDSHQLGLAANALYDAGYRKVEL